MSTVFVAAAYCLPLPNIGFAQDLGTMLDAGWRFYQGLRPHADYHTPLGPMFSLIYGLPFVLAGPTYSSLKFLPPTLSAIAAIWAWAVCRNSLSALSNASTSIAIGCITGGIYHVGFQPEALSFATSYNRVAFGILGIVSLAALLPRRNADRFQNRFNDASMASGLLMLLFLKVNFFIFAIPLAVTCLVIHRRAVRDWAVCTFVACGVLFGFLVWIGFRIDRMWHDLWMAAQARKEIVGTFNYPIRNAVANYDFLGLLVLQSIIWASPEVVASECRYRQLVRQMAFLWGTAILGWSITLMQSHGDGRGISTILTALAISAAWLAADPSDNACHTTGSSTPAFRPTSKTLCRMSEALVCLSALLFVMPHALSYVHWLAVSANPGPPQFQVAALRSLYVGGFVNTLGPECVVKMNDAIDLLQRHCSPGDSMQYLDENNPYGFACSLRSPKNSCMIWETAFTTNDHPAVSDLDDTQFILVPKPALKQVPLGETWRPIYSYSISTYFRVCEETTYFVLYKRIAAGDPQRDAPQGAAGRMTGNAWVAYEWKHPRWASRTSPARKGVAP